MNFVVINPIKTDPEVLTEEVKTENVVHRDLRICRCCLEIEEPLYSLKDKDLDGIFSNLIGLQISGGYVCKICAELLRKFNAFRTRCHNAAYTLNYIDYVDDYLVWDAVKSLNRDNVKHNFSTTEIFETSCPADSNFGQKQRCLGYTDTQHIYIVPPITNDNFTQTENDFKNKNDDNFENDDFNDEEIVDNFGNDEEILDLNLDSDEDHDPQFTGSIAINSSTDSSDVDEQIDDDVDRGDGVEEKNTLLKANVIEPDKVLKRKLYVIFGKILSVMKKTPLKDILQFMYDLSRNKLIVRSSNEFFEAENDIKMFLKMTKELADMYQVDAVFMDTKELIQKRNKIAESEKFKNALYKCNICVKILSKQFMSCHEMKFHNPSLFVCDICNRGTALKKSLHRHALRHLLLMKCKHCSKRFRTWDQAGAHRSRCDKGQVSCDVCGDVFDKKIDYQTHYEYTHVAHTKTTKTNDGIPQNMVENDDDDDFYWPECNTNENTDTNKALTQSDYVKLTDALNDVLRRIQNNLMKHNVFEVLQIIYEESARLKMKDKNDEFTLAESDIRKFMQLNNELCELLQMDFELLDRERMIADFEAKKETVGYKNAKYKCEVCYQTFDNKHVKMFKRHHELFHTSLSYQSECEICHKRYNCQETLFNHAMQHFRKIKCRTCGCYIVKWALAKVHLETKICGDVLCDLCGLSFSGKYSMQKYFDHHREVHLKNNDEPGIECALCGASFCGKNGLRTHKAKMHSEAVQCKSCEVWYLNEDIHNKHLESDGECRPDKRCCPVCGVSFDSEELMMQHNESCRKRSLDCEKCMKTFKNEMLFKRHLKRHTHLKPRSLETIMLNNERKRKDAIRVGEKRVWSTAKRVCPICGRDDFKGTQMYEEHLHLHTGEKPYQCDYCSKSFRRKHLLRVHMCIHTNERRYKCTLCSKAFKQLGHLQSHIEHHSGTKEFECTHCSKRFTQKFNMMAHIRTVHRGVKRKRDTRGKETADNGVESALTNTT